MYCPVTIAVESASPVSGRKKRLLIESAIPLAASATAPRLPTRNVRSVKAPVSTSVWNPAGIPKRKSLSTRSGWNSHRFRVGIFRWFWQKK